MRDDAVAVAIVDYGVGNLFSIGQACSHAGMRSRVTARASEILAADCVILPGMGAFSDAMAALDRLDLVEPLRDYAASGRLLVGICLGMQLVMTESYEFGRHRGLGLIEGPVVRFVEPRAQSGGRLKVPQVGWNRITVVPGTYGWSTSPLAGVRDGAFMYFIHSFYPEPQNPEVVLAITDYGNVRFCSSLMHRNIFATQFHPERSGPEGVKIYGTIAAIARRPAGVRS